MDSGLPLRVIAFVGALTVGIVVLFFTVLNLPLILAWVSIGSAIGPPPGSGKSTAMYGVIDKDNRLLAPIKYPQIADYSEDMAVFGLNQSQGYLNVDGKEAIRANYKFAHSFSDGLALATTYNNREAYLDHRGTVAIGPFDASCTPFRDGVAFLVNGKSDQHNPSNARAIDKNGNDVRSPFLEKMIASYAVNAQNFDELWENKGLQMTSHGICEFDKLIVRARWAQARRFREGLAAVQVDGKWGFVDQEGKFVVAPQFEDVASFGNGFAGVRLNGKWGFVDKAGKVVVKPQFADVGGYNEGFAPVASAMVNGDLGWGFVDDKGVVVIEPRLKDVRTFNEGLAAFKSTDFGKWGFIDKKGAIVIPAQYDSVQDFHCHRAVVSMLN